MVATRAIDHWKDSPGPNKKKLEKSLLGAAKKVPENTRTSQQTPLNLTLWGLFDFFRYFRDFLTDPPKESLQECFWDFGPRGPGDSCKWLLRTQWHKSCIFYISFGPNVATRRLVISLSEVVRAVCCPTVQKNQSSMGSSVSIQKCLSFSWLFLLQDLSKSPKVVLEEESWAVAFPWRCALHVFDTNPLLAMAQVLSFPFFVPSSTQRSPTTILFCHRVLQGAAHKGGGGILLHFCGSLGPFSGPLFHATNWAFSTLKMAPPWMEPSEAPLDFALEDYNKLEKTACELIVLL